MSVPIDIEGLLKLCVAGFMTASLMEMGLRLPAARAVAGLRSTTLLAYAAVFGFLLSTLLAVALARLLMLEAPYALGLILIALTPCAPFLPLLSARAGGDDNVLPVLMLSTALATIAVLPLVLPLLSPELSIGRLDLAKPLFAFIIAPCLVGMTILSQAPRQAALVRRFAHRVAILAALAALLLCAFLYGKGFVGAVGSYAIGAQVLFFLALMVLTHLLTPGLDRGVRTVLVLAMATRNVGAALAPLFATRAIDERAIVMVILAIPIQVALTFAYATWVRGEPAPLGARTQTGRRAE